MDCRSVQALPGGRRKNRSTHHSGSAALRFGLAMIFAGNLAVYPLGSLFKDIDSPNGYLCACYTASVSLIMLLSVLDPLYCTLETDAGNVVGALLRNLFTFPAS
jgi:hypothetical protein